MIQLANCWGQYVRLCYRERFGGNDGILGEFEKGVLSHTGSLREQEVILSRYNLANKPFDFRHTKKEYMKAYEGGVSSGLLEKSIQLLGNQALSKNLSSEQGAQFYRYVAFGRGSVQIDSFVKMWEGINQALKRREAVECARDHLESRDIETALHERSLAYLLLTVYEMVERAR
ncbi:hypothetical protein L873DRAFT_1849105 [Choiromyces venosus 120613-1]|uniref:Uncharacterized protein n=1 Tax=Choiromyces venosus 120613-1 TaxID=1336337 RepID=A0A3N4IZX9_9PEZI|nr:hypothetical protein L873DRAFT_1849105 [Choiromyces venosus 120613-1]